jgi:hypothetical protein
MEASAFRTKTMDDKIFPYKVPTLETKWMKEEKKEKVAGFFLIFLPIYFNKSDYKCKKKVEKQKKKKSFKTISLPLLF